MKLIIFFTAVLLTACGTTKIKDEASVGKVKKVAIVAFTVTEPQPKQITLDIGKGLGASEGGSMTPETSAHVQEMYSNLSDSLGKNLKWNVLGTHEMTTNAGYRQAFDKTMKGWQNKMPAGAGRQDFYVNGVMDWQCMRLLGPEGRDQLIKSLGVDAIIMARSYVNLEGTSVMGIGDQYPKASVIVEVYTPGKEKAVWMETFPGKVSETSVGKTALFSTEILKKTSLASFKSATANIGKTVQ